MQNPTVGSAAPVIPVSIEEEMKSSYLDYAMSVIVSRALPDVRDGLKPVHRRILYSMYENGYDYNKPFRKSARIVGDVMGKYHPHGDSAIYDSMVRMAQDFAMRLPLVSPQGNFGSMDGDSAAAMRYTEARLAHSAHTLLEDLDLGTVDFIPNYDESTKEPSVLPARFPNLLINGGGGIAVGMATNIPPHNLGEVIDACCAFIDNKDITPEELMEYVPGPDFPTGGIILGSGGARSAYMTGRGSILMRGRVRIEEMKKDRSQLIISEVPYQVNKAALVSRIAELVREKQIEGISDLRDESDRHGVRVVVEIKKDHQADVVLNQLYKHTPLQTSFGANMLALNGGRPQLLSLHDIIKAFISYRQEVIRRRTIYLLGKARDRAHTLVGLAIAVESLDPVIKMIRGASDPVVAKAALMAESWPAGTAEPLIALIDEPGHKVVDGRYKLSEAQAKAILDLRLHRLTGLERDKIHAELKEIGGSIQEYLSILADKAKLFGIMRTELLEVKEKFATPRRTTIEEGGFEQDDEDLIQREDLVVTITDTGYIKRVPLSTYRAQKRGGKGRSAMSTHDEDRVAHLFSASTHTPILFFSSKGKVYKLKGYKLPVGSPQSAGRALINLLPVEQGETITAVMGLPEKFEDCKGRSLMFATASGNVRRNRMEHFFNILSNGKIAMKLEDGDRLIEVLPCQEHDHDILLATRLGKCIRFPVSEIRLFAGRQSDGVRGIRLAPGDEVISMSVLTHIEASSARRLQYLKMAKALRRAAGEEQEDLVEETLTAEEVEEGETPEASEAPVTLSQDEFNELAAAEQFILTVTSSGLGKRSSAYDYRITRRGGSGLANTDLARRLTVVGSFPVEANSQVMMVTDKGQLIRMPVTDIRIASRSAKGVILFRLDGNEKVVSVTGVAEDAVDEAEVPEGSETLEASESPDTAAVVSEIEGADGSVV